VAVISSGKIIFCEGKQTSLDSMLLNKIVDGLSDKPTIVGAGSKFTFSVFAEGYFSQKMANQRYIIFRDRDFDVTPTPDIQLLKSSKMFLTHRACIENYLLDANLIDTYWKVKHQEKMDNSSSKWGHGDSPGFEAIATWIENGAHSLTDYQAVRWALGDLTQMRATRTQLKTTWTEGSGNLPQSLSGTDCHNEAVKLVEKFRESIGTVTLDKFESSLTKYQDKFAQAKFWEQKQYLIWFHGKDIQKAMQRQESHYISLKSYFSSIIEQFDVTKHLDLVELRIKIEEL